MDLGKLTFVPAHEAPELVAEPVRPHLRDGLWVSPIDPDLADTAAFCEHYDIGLDVSANCVVVEARRADREWLAACLVLATARADVNGIVRKHLGARKISFAPMDSAVSVSGMEYGGITPVGLPADWPLLVDLNVMDQQHVIIGSGIRGSKLLAATEVLASLPNAEVLDIAMTRLAVPGYRGVGARRRQSLSAEHALRRGISQRVRPERANIDRCRQSDRRMAVVGTPRDGGRTVGGRIAGYPVDRREAAS
jgi:prolyl-tRNA editing enzyme YbaK/EbsC (Cys-tRNA(Pro) deacylase)